MILVAGGTGTLGTQIVRRLNSRGVGVRVLTRNADRFAQQGPLVDVVPGDVRNASSLQAAMRGATAVVSAVHGFADRGSSPETVDHDGNRNLIRAARDAGVRRFILMSVHRASPNHPMSLHRMKHRAEQELRASGLEWTIIRPTAYMETWAKLVGEPLVSTGKTRIFGRGDNAINFVSAHDVARLVELAVLEQRMVGEVVEIGGLENLTMKQVAEIFERVTGRKGKVSHVPLPMMRLMSVLMRPLNPSLARQIHAGVVMDTSDMTFDPAGFTQRYPSLPLTGLAEVVLRDYRPKGAKHAAGG